MRFSASCSSRLDSSKSKDTIYRFISFRSEIHQTFYDLCDKTSLDKMKLHTFGRSILLTKSLKSFQQSASRLLTTSGNGNYSATLGIKEDGTSKSDM